MTRLLYGLGRACARWRFVVLGLWVVLIVALVVVAGQAGSEANNNVTLPGTGSQHATDLLGNRFPSQAYGTNPLVVATDSGKLTDSKYSKAINSSVSNLKKTPHVTAAISPLSNAGSSALSKNKQIGYISVALDVGQGSITDDDANAVLDAANPAKKAGLQVAVGGHGPPVVLLHGLFSDAQMNWIKFGHADRIAGEGFRVIMPDLRSHGESGKAHDPAKYPPDVLVRDLRDLIAHLGLDVFDLGGFSLGSRTAIDAVSSGLRPRRAILSGTGIDVLTNWEKRCRFFLEAIERGLKYVKEKQLPYLVDVIAEPR